MPGFWDGGSTFRIRFAPTVAGRWQWRTFCSTGDPGLDGHRGEVAAAPWAEADEATDPHRRGFLRVHESGRYFTSADGTPFFWLGDTIWAAHARRCDPGHAFPAYLADRQRKGFSVIQAVVAHPTGHTGPEARQGAAPEPDYHAEQGHERTAGTQMGLGV